MRSRDRDDGDDHEAAETTSPLEWLVAGVGALLVVFTVGYMVQFALTRPEGPPAVVLEVTGVSRASTGYLVSFTATNTGLSTGAGIVVTGELSSGGARIEASEMTLDYLPQDSERQGGLFFTQDPAAHELVLRAQGYAEP
ncbi:TIGR02588 family protein [Phenylobacterium sp.]|uniref:TIGR02588 family protein n=1 Tax=Phenylobacterium sp. TaxID=1871053 RepID=UPI00261F56D0|nr:TIGR02588 family protein [Phenylobacterium sp.]